MYLSGASPRPAGDDDRRVGPDRLVPREALREDLCIYIYI